MTMGNGEGTSGFADLTLAPELCQALSDLGYGVRPGAGVASAQATFAGTRA